MKRTPPRRRKSIVSSGTPSFEALENRQMFAAAIGYDATLGVVSIYGTDASDSAEVKTQSGGGIQVRAWDAVSQNTRTFSAGIKKIVFYGGNGNDWFRNLTAISSEAWGGYGNDTLIGGSGNDWLEGQWNDDYLYGGAGNDRLYGWTGNDLLSGEAGEDYLSGWEGNDRIWGGSEKDTIYGGTGNDTIYGGTGDDWITGQEHNDTIFGEGGHDIIYGYTGNDIIDGGSGNDMLSGWDGNDRLYGNSGDDVIYGHEGNDSLWGGGGRDKLYSGAGADRFLWPDSSDLANDKSSQDVNLRFYNNTSTWTYDEIKVMDEAFARLVNRTGNNMLLRETLSSSDLKFYKDVQSGKEAGFNMEIRHAKWNFLKFRWDYSYTREIHIDDWNEFNTFENNGAIDIIIHEIGHNWDSVKEIGRFMSDRTSLWGNFTAQSDWRSSNPGGYILSGDGKWYHKNVDNFAWSYGRENPKEDFATSFAKYFDIYHNQGPFAISGGIAGTGNGAFQGKLNVLDNLFASMKRFA